jgi:rod shape determining protein RodA
MPLEVSVERGDGSRRVFARFPWHIAFIVMAICAIGVWNLASASRTAHAPVWIDQAIMMGIGAVLVLAMCFVDYRRFMGIAWVYYAVVIVLLVLVFMQGRTIMGARRWIHIGPFNLQPSELAKIAVILALSRYFHMSDNRRGPMGLRQLILPVVITLVPAVLTLKQPDLGTALMITATGGTIILFAGVRWKTVALVVASVVALAFFAYPHLKPYQKKRVETFLNPEGDVLGAGYHATQSMIAVGSGQATGKGWGQGTQTLLSFLPEQHTDFVFSVWAEEHGFIGCAVLLFLFYLLVTSGLTITGNARDRFGHFVAVGVTGMIFWQAFVNIGMVTGTLPVVGVTLPLMSYGRSSVLAVMLGIGLLVNVGMRRFVN